MEVLKIKKIVSKPFVGQYGATNKVGIITEKYGDEWLNGFVDNVDFVEGDNIFAEVRKNGKYLNFKYRGKNEGENSPDLPKTAEKTYISPNMQKTQEKPNFGQIRGNDVDWGKIAFGKCKTLFLVELFKHNLDKEKSMTKTEMEKISEEMADMSVRRLSRQDIEQQEIYNEMHSGHVEDDIKISEIPF